MGDQAEPQARGTVIPRRLLSAEPERLSAKEKRTMTRSRWLPLILLLAVACGGGDEPASPNAGGPATPQSPAATAAPEARGKPFEIVESATNISPSFTAGEFFVTWAAVMKNPNADLFGSFPTVVVTARDDQGAVVGTDDHVMESIPPGGTIAFASQVKATARPTTIDIAFKKVAWTKTQTKSADYPPFTAEKVAMKPDRVAGFTVTGDLRNPYALSLIHI